MTIQGSQAVTYLNTSKDTLQELVMHTYADANRSKATQTMMYTDQNEQIAKEHPEKKASEFLGGMDIVNVTQQGRSFCSITKSGITCTIEGTFATGANGYLPSELSDRHSLWHATNIVLQGSDQRSTLVSGDVCV